jgi:hypothetical protein
MAATFSVLEIFTSFPEKHPYAEAALIDSLYAIIKEAGH